MGRGESLQPNVSQSIVKLRVMSGSSLSSLLLWGRGESFCSLSFTWLRAVAELA